MFTAFARSGGLEFLKHLNRIGVFWVPLERFLIVSDGLRFVPSVHVSLPKAVIGIA
jgi:hypothetical protein